MNGANVEEFAGAGLLGAPGHEEGIALFASDMPFAMIWICEEVTFGDGLTRWAALPPNFVLGRGGFIAASEGWGEAVQVASPSCASSKWAMLIGQCGRWLV